VSLSLVRIVEASWRNIRAAAEVVRGGGLVVYPTDTVYGLGCDPFNVDAVQRVIRVKGRSEKPMPILCSDLESVGHVAEVSERGRLVGRRFWPGPLTLVLKKKTGLPSVVTFGLPSVGVRIPEEDVALQLIRRCGGVLVGTSANRTGRPPPLTAKQAFNQLGRDVDLTLNGGRVKLGLPSTIIDLTREEPQVLRHGSLDPTLVINSLSLDTEA
jgi:L-threonylcarbamoyladenylate synthase